MTQGKFCVWLAILCVAVAFLSVVLTRTLFFETLAWVLLAGVMWLLSQAVSSGG